jgi:pimeloyl-ACP methyl ester carboxylesterase
VLVHSSMAGARQWAALTQGLQDRFLVRAVNLFGYGKTPTWSGTQLPSLEDYAGLIASAVPAAASNVTLIGHSFGGAVAMQCAAHQLKGQVERLVLIEPSPFYLLDISGHEEAFREITMLAQYTSRCIANKTPAAAAEWFIDYWCGAGTWTASSADRRAMIVRSIGLLLHEWNAVLAGKDALAEWTAALPQNTLVMSSTKTRRPSSELVELLLDARPDWGAASIRDAGHMAPMTHPQLVNSIIGNFLG